jgi:ferritin
MLLSQDRAAALSAHMGREFGAEMQYLSLSAYFEAEGLPQLAAFFLRQAEEEHGHAMRFFAYIRNAGGPVGVPAIEGPKTGFESAEEAVQLALDWELAVTRQINELVDMAREQRDHATEVFLQWFVSEQVEEVSTMSELLQIVRRAGEAGLLLVEEHVARTRSAHGEEE